MRSALLAVVATLALAGAARAQETKGHEHEHTQPPAATEQKPGADHKEMCACCRKDGGTDAMRQKMAEKMKEMMKEKEK